LFVAGALTVDPLFWFTSPWFATATLGEALTTTGADVAVWFASFEASFDCVAVCSFPPEGCEQQLLVPVCPAV
jgi:hypothetical protein